MSAGSALITGPEASPQMVEDAVRQALRNANLSRANGVMLMLSRDFSRCASQAVLAAARTAGCLQVAGATADGLFTETGWTLNQPAAAALVLGGDFALAPNGDGLKLCFAESAMPLTDWLRTPRIGLLHNGGPFWQQARLSGDGRAETTITGTQASYAVSAGLKMLGGAQAITAVRGFDLQRLGEQNAVDNLQRVMPPELRERNPLPIHLFAALRNGCMDAPAIPLLSANAEGSVTLAQPLPVGDTIAWAMRQPLAAENDMAEALEKAASRLASIPTFGIQFSCIGRGPLFYNGEDRDLAVWQRRFPGVPLIGAYGSGQLAPIGEASRQWQNTVVSALFCERHV